jgi:antitoxin (DNA-binding transcriptional repressor) of toxin-antitoxin stability system
MRTVSISVTDASRNFADCVNRARYQGTTFLLHKNGVAVARIAPVERNSKNKEELENGDADEAAKNGGLAAASGEDAGEGKLPAPEIW